MISLRLYKVLATNVSDDATKEALCTLSELYTPTTGPGKGKDVKNLRRDMESKLAEGSRQFLKAFGEVDQKLDELQDHVSSMRLRCEEAETQLRLTDEASKTLLERASKLQEERQEVETRKSIVSLFLARFTLTDEEVEAMTSRDVPVGKFFFNVMDKTEQIRKDCRVLMAGEDGPTKAGSDIMASTSSYLERGYEKIYRWCSYEFRQVGRDLQLEVGTTMREAVSRLRKRPELLSEALTSLSETRQTTLLNAFLTALTRGGSSGLPRPIEIHAHDPMRYVGDMLAWVHQAIAAEHEFLVSLFGLKHDGRMVGSVRIPGTSEEEEWIRELMDLAIGKLCVPLKARVQQTVRSQESSIITYKIANLLQFYMLTMRRTIGDSALLSTALQDMTNIAYKVFHDAIETQGRALLRVPLDLDDPSVTPPLVILDHTQILREIMTVYQSSLLDEGTNVERATEFQDILDVMVDPVIEMCTVASGEKKRVKQGWDMEVFMLNCLTYVQSVLEPFEFTTEKQRDIQDMIDVRVKMLTGEHYENILKDAGIRDAVSACESHSFTEPLSRLPETSAMELQSALHKFSVWLSGLEVVQSPRLGRLTVQRLHTQIHQSALERVAGAYELICEEVRRPENKYEAASTLLGSERPFGQVHLLWQIFGLQERDENS